MESSFQIKYTRYFEVICTFREVVAANLFRNVFHNSTFRILIIHKKILKALFMSKEGGIRNKDRYSYYTVKKGLGKVGISYLKKWEHASKSGDFNYR